MKFLIRNGSYIRCYEAATERESVLEAARICSVASLQRGCKLEVFDANDGREWEVKYTNPTGRCFPRPGEEGLGEIEALRSR